MRQLLVISTVTLTIAALLYLNYSYLPKKSFQQLRYESWLKSLESRALEYARVRNVKGSEGPKDPVAEIEVDLVTAKDPSVWSIGGTSTPTTQAHQEQPVTSKVMRVLSLIREADLFSIESSAQSEAADQVKLSVQAGETHFVTTFPPVAIENNNPAKLLLKLLEVYHQEELEQSKDMESQHAQK